MRSLQPVILLIMVDNIGNQLLLIETTLIDSIFGEVRLDDIQLAQMPPTLALITHTFLIMMMLKVVAHQLGGCFAKIVLLSEAEFVVVAATLGLAELADV